MNIQGPGNHDSMTKVFQKKNISNEPVKTSFFNGKKDEVTLSARYTILEMATEPVVNQSTNSITIEPDKAYSLGEVNGKPLRFRLFQDGGFETNFSLRLSHDPETSVGKPVTAYEANAAKIFDSYSAEEHRQENRLMGRLMHLLQVADGKISVEQFNEYKSAHVASTQELLVAMGIDINRTFAINGVDFSLENGHLKRQ